MTIVHYPVMHKEVLEFLTFPTENPVMIDCTTGEGGHTSLFLAKYPTLTVYGLDRDRGIQQKAIERLAEYGPRFKPVNCWFNEYLEDVEPGSVDGILFDLGISSYHYAESERGFSFRKEEKLDMRLNLDQKLDAASVVNEYDEEELANVIYEFGEERYSRMISRAICRARSEKRIETSKELADIIFNAVPAKYRYQKIHPATRSFQAIRIEVNKELCRIEPALESAVRALKVGGRIAVITFHSLEDRPVKWFFKNLAGGEEPKIRILTKKPIVPSEQEERENSPSRSAKLRVIEKVRV
jgi:S-adenosyl-methyltransferase MraW